jgi:hypothetical protein
VSTAAKTVQSQWKTRKRAYWEIEIGNAIAVSMAA